MSTDQSSPKGKLTQALEQSDNHRREKRADRIRWVSQYRIGEVGEVIAGPFEVMSLLSEARECFVDGHYIATLMLATALIEHVISDELVARNKAKYGTPFERLIKIAREEALFPLELLEVADRLRAIRNPFAHHKPDDHEHRLGNRYFAQKRHPGLIAEEDAKEALIAM